MTFQSGEIARGGVRRTSLAESYLIEIIWQIITWQLSLRLVMDNMICWLLTTELTPELTTELTTEVTPDPTEVPHYSATPLSYCSPLYCAFNQCDHWTQQYLQSNVVMDDLTVWLVSVMVQSVAAFQITWHIRTNHEEVENLNYDAPYCTTSLLLTIRPHW